MLCVSRQKIIYNMSKFEALLYKSATGKDTIRRAGRLKLKIKVSKKSGKTGENRAALGKIHN